jgi:hypothetical protein
MGKLWKKGRGKLGVFQPLHGRWVAEAHTEMGPVRCSRRFEPVLGGNYIELRARWEFGRLAAKPDSKDAKESNPGTPKVGGDSSNMPMVPLERPEPAFPSVE